MKPIESLLRTFLELHPEDAARAFETLDPSERARIFKMLPPRVAVTLLERISPHAATPLITKLDAARAGELLRAMPPRAASLIFHQLDVAHREQLLSALPENVSRSILELARYPIDTAGGIMEPRVASLAIDFTVQQAISAIRQTPGAALPYLYVTDRSGRLCGVINMRDLLLAAPRDSIQPIVKRNVVSIPDTMDGNEVVRLMREHRFLALPVVDIEGRLIGVVKHAEALQAGQDAAFQDLQRIVGAGADERALSPVSMVVRSRLPWLYVNLLTAFMAAAVVGVFEDLIAQVAALAVLLPVVAGQGGNTGSQSLAVVMRGLSLREIIPGDNKRVVGKELAGGIINGVAVAVVTAAVVFAWRSVAGDAVHAAFGLALVIGLAMVVNMAAASLSGAVIPLFLKAVGRDPAQSAAIFLTTVTDIVGFASFLGFATMFMSWID